MNAPPVVIGAVVDELERPALVAAVEQLAECLGVASGLGWPVRIQFRSSIAEIAQTQSADANRPAVVIVSLLPEIKQDGDSLSVIEARWRAQIPSLFEADMPAILVCTIFRHVAPGSEPGARERAAGLRERIRRLDLLATDLSHDLGIGVIDIDRVLAHYGARPLRTDYRLTGRIAAEVAGYVITDAILAAGLDDLIAPEIQERAREYQGGLHHIDRLLTRRLRLKEGVV